MLDQTIVSLLESGSALIVGLVSADGDPVAGRAWGLRVLDGSSGQPVIRVLLSGHDVETARTTVGSEVAVTGADVATFRSAQVKGRIHSVEAPTAKDLELSRAYVDAYFGAISRGDATERALLGRMEPSRVVAVVLTVDEGFDQTPGPGAGAPLDQAAEG